MCGDSTTVKGLESIKSLPVGHLAMGPTITKKQLIELKEVIDEQLRKIS